MNVKPAFRRTNIRLASANYVGFGTTFVTICCHHRQEFLTAERARAITFDLRATAARHRFAIYAYCIMPNHVHLLATGEHESSNLLNFVKDFKRATTLHFHGAVYAPLWQKKFYDHILRPKDSLNLVAAYIWMNPVRKGLCATWQDYSLSGSLVLDWKKACVTPDGWIPPWRQRNLPDPDNGSASTKPI